MGFSDDTLRDIRIDPDKAAQFREERARRDETFNKAKHSIEDGARLIHAQRRHVGSFESCDECKADLQKKVDEARNSIVYGGRYESPGESRRRRQKAKKEKRRERE